MNHIEDKLWTRDHFKSAAEQYKQAKNFGYSNEDIMWHLNSNEEYWKVRINHLYKNRKEERITLKNAILALKISKEVKSYILSRKR